MNTIKFSIRQTGETKYKYLVDGKKNVSNTLLLKFSIDLKKQDTL